MSSFNMGEKKDEPFPINIDKLRQRGRGEHLWREEKVQLLDWITKPKFSGNDMKKVFKFIAI